MTDDAKWSIALATFSIVVVLLVSVAVTSDIRREDHRQLDSRVIPARITYIEHADNNYRGFHVAQNRFSSVVHVTSALELANYTHWQCVAIRCADFNCSIIRALPDSVCRAIEGGR